MKKIISLFERNYDTDHLVRNEVVPGAEWVINGEGVATRKWDGTACLVRDGKLYRRYDAKNGKTPPVGFEPCEEAPDLITTHWPGWLPIGDGPEDKWFRESFQNSPTLENGTYELCGPKFQTNSEGFDSHVFIPHGNEVLEKIERSFESIKAYLARTEIEGIVWWRDWPESSSEMVKIKRRDFGFTWPIKREKVTVEKI